MIGLRGIGRAWGIKDTLNVPMRFLFPTLPRRNAGPVVESWQDYALFVMERICWGDLVGGAGKVAQGVKTAESGPVRSCA